MSRMKKVQPEPLCRAALADHVDRLRQELETLQWSLLDMQFAIGDLEALIEPRT